MLVQEKIIRNKIKCIKKNCVGRTEYKVLRW